LFSLMGILPALLLLSQVQGFSVPQPETKAMDLGDNCSALYEKIKTHRCFKSSALAVESNVGRCLPFRPRIPTNLG
jgi:hypothetical protein